MKPSRIRVLRQWTRTLILKGNYYNLVWPSSPTRTAWRIILVSKKVWTSVGKKSAYKDTFPSESRWVMLGHLRVGVIKKKWVTGVWPLPLVFHWFIYPEYLNGPWKPSLFFQFFLPASCSRCSTASTSPSRSTTAASGSSSVTRSPTASTTKVRPLDFCHGRCHKCNLRL